MTEDGQRMKPAYFAIIGAMRTGSNLLEKTLEALGDTACYGEAFNPGFIGGPVRESVPGWTVARRDADPRGFLEHLIELTPDRIPGFRIFDGHNRAVLDTVLADPSCARIVLRRDPVESYVSLKIARLTDQWMLRNPARRISARVRFDADEFAQYKARLDAHYAHAGAVMRSADTHALQIDYTDLTSPVVMARAAVHIGSTGQPPTRPPIVRQNTASMAEKVENYAEMCEALGLAPEPAADTAPVCGLIVPKTLPVRFAAIPGAALLPAMAILNRLAADRAGEAPLSLGRLKDCVTEGTLFPTEETLEPACRAAVAARPIFALTAHPLRRIFEQFAEDLFGAGWRQSILRRMVAQAVPGLPDGGAAFDIVDGWPGETRAAAFDAYLDLVHASLAGTGAILCPANWVPQSVLLDTLPGEAVVTHAFGLDAFDSCAAWLCEQTTAAPLPKGQLRGLATAGLRCVADPVGLVDETRVRALYAADYDRLGYA